MQAVVPLVRYVEVFFAMLNPCFLGQKTLTGKNGAEGWQSLESTLAIVSERSPNQVGYCTWLGTALGWVLHLVRYCTWLGTALG